MVQSLTHKGIKNEQEDRHIHKKKGSATGILGQMGILFVNHWAQNLQAGERLLLHGLQLVG
jgi:hypothetical protein